VNIIARVGPNAVVSEGCIYLDLTTQYGTLQVPIRGFRTDILAEEGHIANVEIDIHLPEWVIP
jgi:hypothetical protein